MSGYNAMTREERLRELFAGVTTFAAMSYIMFTNPAILRGMSMPPGPVFLWTCVTAGLASEIAARATRLPTALACGMGLNVFTVAFAQVQGVAWPPLILTAGVVSVIVLLLSVTQFRYTLIEAIPPQIFAAIKGGIGGILTTIAVEAIPEFAMEPGWPAGTHSVAWAFGLFALGLLLIVGTKLLCANLDASASLTTVARQWSNVFDSASFLVSIVILIPIILVMHRPESLNPQTSLLFSWQTATNAQFASGDLTKLLTYGFAISFIMLLDIAGSPIDYIKQEFVDPATLTLPEVQIVRRSLIADSAFNILAAAVGVTPMVYYAENHAGWQAGGRTALVGRTVAAGFLIFAAIGALCIWQNWPIAQVIPRFAAMPTLFFVGLMLVAGSFVLPASAVIPATHATGPDLQTQAHSTGQTVDPTVSAARPMVARTMYFVPAAITTVLASVTLQLDIALAAGIISYLVISLFPESYLGVRDRQPRRLDLIYAAAIFVLILSLWNYAISVANSTGH